MTQSPNSQAVVNMSENKVAVDDDGKGGVWKWCTLTTKLALSEVISTMLLILLGCMTNLTVDGDPLNPLIPALGFGFLVMVNIQVFGHVSGAHMNPAVTIAALLFGHLSVITAIIYIIAQFAGAILGYGILMNLTPGDIAAEGVCVNHVHAGLNVWQALAIETALTSVLSFLCCSIWDPVNKDKMDSVPIKFGMMLVALGLASGPLTGCGMNPARSFGPALFSGRWENFWLFCVGPVIGAIVPTLLYKLIFLEKEKNKTEVQGQQQENK